MYRIEGVVTGMVATNCYTLINEESKEAIFIDVSGDVETLTRVVKNENLTPQAVLLTHAHFDHMDAVDGIREEFPDIEVIIGENDAPLLENPMSNLSLAFTGTPISTKADRTVSDGEVISLIGLTIKCIEVPGHTIGGMCYYIDNQINKGDNGDILTKTGLLFDGDTLFYASIGRSDFPTGDEEALLNNIRKKLFVLPEDTLVLPGHNNKTSIKMEKNNNPYFD